MIQIWHAKEPNFGCEAFGPPPRWPNDYELVAEVETDVLEHAFLLTNNINDSWMINDGVTVRGNRETYRSTSIGDVAVSPEGVFRVDALGWTQLDVASA